MPKWLSSALILIGVIAVASLTLLPRSVTVTVTTNNVSENEYTTVYNGKVHIETTHNGAVATAAPESRNGEDKN